MKGNYSNFVFYLFCPPSAACLSLNGQATYFVKLTLPETNAYYANYHDVKNSEPSPMPSDL